MTDRPTTAAATVKHARPVACSACGGALIRNAFYQSGCWWSELTCLSCGRVPAGQEVRPAELAAHARRARGEQLLPRDEAGWRAVMTRRYAA